MNKFKFYFVVISIGIVLFSCSKDDSTTPIPVRAYDAQYKTDSTTIENYLNTYYIEKIINNPGFADDQDITITKIPTGGSQPSIFSLLDSTTYPMLLSKNIELHDITYKIYYLKLRADNNVDGKSPTQVDEILTSYVGSYLSDNSTGTGSGTDVDVSATPFEAVVYPQQRLGLDGVIVGWSEIFPLFKTGNYNAEPSPDPATFLNFGAGVMFLPSGLAYFNVAKSSIPSYSPLVFSFKLYDLKRADQDADGILSMDELDRNGDSVFDDTDGDGTPDYLDRDDDGDGYMTINEIKINGVIPSSYDLILDCSESTTGVKKHLDKSCH